MERSTCKPSCMLIQKHLAVKILGHAIRPAKRCCPIRPETVPVILMHTYSTLLQYRNALRYQTDDSTTCTTYDQSKMQNTEQNWQVGVCNKNCSHLYPDTLIWQYMSHYCVLLCQALVPCRLFSLIMSEYEKRSSPLSPIQS